MCLDCLALDALLQAVSKPKRGSKIAKRQIISVNEAGKGI